MDLARVCFVLVLAGAVTSKFTCRFDDKLLETTGRQGRSLVTKWYLMKQNLRTRKTMLELIVWGEGAYESLSMEAMKKIRSDISRNLGGCLSVSVRWSTANRIRSLRRSNPNYVFVEIKGACYRDDVLGIAYPDRTVVIGSTLCDDEYSNNIFAWNAWRGLVLHELFHVLGIGHTHRRSDRDEYITVNYSNLEDGWFEQYEKCPRCKFHGPYECNSVMHYEQGTGGKIINGEIQDTMLVNPGYERRCFFPDVVTRTGTATKNDWDSVRLILPSCPTRGRSGRALPWWRNVPWGRRG
jgi:hypothetical protein